MKKEQNKKYYYIGGIVALVIIAIIVAILVVSCNRKEKYDVQLLVDNKNYYQDKIREGETIKGVTEPRKEGYTFVGWYAGDKKVDLNDPITDDTKLEARWEINTYTITIDLGNGNTVTREVNYNETVTLPEIPIRYGYIFDGWYVDGEKFDADTKIGKDTTITAKWIEVSNVSYTVKHYLMGLDGKYTNIPFASETFVVKDGTTVRPQPKTYEGFTSPSGQTIVVRESGNNVINYYYERCKYEFTLVGDNGVLETLSDGKYYYGEEVVIDFTIKPGYTFEGYSEDIEEDTYVMPSKDVTIEIITSPNEDTEYTVEHYIMGTDGKYSTEPDYVDNLTGTTDTTVTAPVRELGEGFVIPTEEEVTITGDGQAVVEYRYERKQFTLTLTKSDTLGAGIESLDGDGLYYYGQSVVVTANVKEGYTFASWQPGNIDRNTFTYIMSASDSTLTASATANTDTKYTVKHYVMGTDGEYPTEPTYVDNLTGTTDTTVTAPVKELGEGFVIPSEEEVTITGDGKAVVEYRYERRQFTLMLAKSDTLGAGIESLEGDGTYYYGASVVVTANVKEGYTFVSWTPGNIDKNTFTYVIPASDTTLTASTTANTDTKYTVKHYVMGLDGKYPTEPTYVDNLTGTTDTTVTAPVKELGEGFIIPSEKEITITGDGKAIVEYRYERRQFTLTLTPGTGIESLEGDGKYYYGASVTVTANVKEGYTFETWTPGNIDKNTFTYVIPASDTTLTASATANTDTKYTVKHYIMGLDGEYPAEPNYVDNLTGTTDTTVTAKVKELSSGFVIPSEKEVTITGDGQAVVEYRYERRQFTLMLAKSATLGAGIESLEGEGTYYYGTKVRVKALVKEGYTFETWVPVNVIETEFDYEIPSSNIILIASATPNTYTVTFDAGTDATFEGEKEVKVKYLEKVPEPNVEPERLGYTFAGWFDSENNEWDFENATMPYEDLALHAKWELVEYDLKYYYLDNMNEKHYLDNKDNPSKYTIESEDITLTEISRETEGYQFVSFNSDKVKEENILSVKGSTGIIEVELKYTPINYEIKYYYLDSKGTKQYLEAGTNPTTYNVESEDVTLTEISRETEGYRFTKFNSDRVNEANSLSLKGKTGNIEIELQYTMIDYTITYDLQDGETCTDCDTENKYTVEGRELPEPTKENFVFDGWEITASEDEILKDTVITEIEKGTTGNLTLKAKWVKLIDINYINSRVINANNAYWKEKDPKGSDVDHDISQYFTTSVDEDNKVVYGGIINHKDLSVIGSALAFNGLDTNLVWLASNPEIASIELFYGDSLSYEVRKNGLLTFSFIGEIAGTFSSPVINLDNKQVTVKVTLNGDLAKTKEKKTVLEYTLDIQCLGYVSAEEFKETVNKVKPSVDNNNKNGQHFTIDDSDAINGNIVLRYSDENIVIGTSVFGMGMSSSLTELVQDPNIDYIEVTLPKKGTMTVRDKADASSVASAVFSDMAQYMKEKTGDPTKDTPSITNDDLRNYKYTVKVKIVLANNGYFEKGIPTEYTITFDKKKD